VPHSVKAVPATQTSPTQHPDAQLDELQSDGGGLGVQAREVESQAPVDVQSEHACPPAPHARSLRPETHALVPM